MIRYVAAGALTGATWHALTVTGLAVPFAVTVGAAITAAYTLGLLLRNHR